LLLRYLSSYEASRLGLRITIVDGWSVTHGASAFCNDGTHYDAAVEDVLLQQIMAASACSLE
jgi:hypothetical protein